MPHHPPKPRSAQAHAHPKPTDWNRVADWYDQLVGPEGSEYQQHVVFPGLLKMLQLAPGRRVLDIACGQGALSRLMHQRGAVVVGVDASPRLLELARQQSDPAIEFHQADARDLVSCKALKASSFDAAVCVLAIQNIDPINSVFENAAWALRAGGNLALVMMHPAFRGPKAAAWGWDAQQSVQYRRVDRYLLPHKQPIVSHPGRKDGSYTWTFHRPLEKYVKALVKAGFLVDGLEEWPSHKTSHSGPRAKAENTARKEIPMFLALRAVKTQTPAS
ncbi:MAG: class I SAM-dependent methyltransferase [Phycisphaeraceae bacterium]|nr:class I SAM-dependent methyltransferase [Phycisphaeraceae bacterium]